ncbi:MAG: hypothetical protein H5T61_16000 [Thermoflexales bacterium]|nr:hypothetical protein [Thermoflexales bacterium]
MSVRRRLITIMSIVLLLGLLFGLTASGQSLLAYIDQLFRPAKGDEGQEIIARVNGQPVYRSQLNTFEMLLSIQGATPADQVTRQAFGMLVEYVVLQQEAERRGIYTSEAEARAFMEQQRQLWQQSPPSDPAVRAVVSQTMQSAGFKSEDEYWEKMVDYYAHLLNLSKLRQQIYLDVPPPSDEEVRSYLAEHPIQSALVFIPIYVEDWGKASVLYADLVRKAKILGLDGLATEVDRIARQYKRLGPTQPTVESYQFTSPSELPEHAQEALALSEGEVGLVKNQSGSPVIVLVLSKVLVDEATAKEYARSQLREQRAKEHYQSVVEDLLRKARVEILAPDLKTAFPQGLLGIP